ncbi:MAG: L-seryl-tRNA(Sec) selenium transferase [Anaerolineaceae bacterium]
MTEAIHLPSIDSLLQLENTLPLLETFGHELVVGAFRQIEDIQRHAGKYCTPEQIIEESGYLLLDWTTSTLVPVINASGVVLHTNLGRAPLSEGTYQEMKNIAVSFNNLEYDLETGKRGKRSIHAEQILTRLTGVESAYVVNNNAAAVLLVLTALAQQKRVLVSRTQMVEIGGGFRVPDVMRQSGAKLVEIGTTNRLHLYDYENALQEPAALVLCAHQSNFKIVGFTSEPSLEEICILAHQKGTLVFHDLGSGALLDTAQYGLPHEPMVQESLQAGVDVVSFSGDKLLGGPQAGIILGKKELLDKIRKHPLARALRPDKLCLAGISTTLLYYLTGKAEKEIPVWQMISLSTHMIHQRAMHWKEILGCGDIIEGRSMIGGGSLPDESLPSSLLALKLDKPDKFLKILRGQNPPIIARIENGNILFDPRTVLPHQEACFLEILQQTLTNWNS